MSVVLDAARWFSESCREAGSVFSLAVTEKLHEEQSEFQHIAVYQTSHWGRLLVIDGFIMLSSLDNFVYHEMMVHPVLHTHPNPRQVLIIGGGDCGTLREVLKHASVECAVQVDIDERVTRVSEHYFPELCESNRDPRAELLFADGIRYVENAPPASVDVIIVDSTDPIGPGEVLFSEAFYGGCRRALGQNGLLVQQSESPLIHLQSVIQPMYRRLRAAGFAHIRTLQFPQPVYPSGWWTCTMASKDHPLGSFREQAAQGFNGLTRYYSADIHRGALAIPPFLQDALATL
jgi:spermidine synthase